MRGSILIGNLNRAPMTILTACGGTQSIADHFLTAFADAHLAEIEDFVDGTLHDRPARVTGEDVLKDLAMAVAAENSYLSGMPAKVSLGCDGRKT